MPVAIFLLSIILVAFFYRLLPAEIAYSFKSGSLDRLTGRGVFLAWTLVPQLCLTLLAAVIVWGVTQFSARYQQIESTAVRKLLVLMGNMVALPQIILTFAMLDIFLYNSYQIHIMPLWLFALVVTLAGVIIMGIIFSQAIGQIREVTQK